MFEGYTVQVGHDAGDKDHGGRSPEQCMNRFQKAMKPDLLLFNQYFKQLENEEPSGVPYKDLVKIAHKRYNAQTKKEPFRFIQCVPTLHKILKFQPFNSNAARFYGFSFSSGSADIEGGETSGVGSVMGENQARPPGRKAAKTAARTERKRKSYASSSSSGKENSPKEAPDESNAQEGPKDEVATSFVAISKNIDRLEKALTSSTYVNKLAVMIGIEQDCGNEAGVEKLRRRLREFIEKEEQEEQEAKEASKASSQSDENNNGGIRRVCPPTGLAEGRKKYALESDSEEDDDLFSVPPRPLAVVQQQPVVGQDKDNVVHDVSPGGPPGTFTQLGNEWRARLARARVIQEEPDFEQQPLVGQDRVVEKQPGVQDELQHTGGLVGMELHEVVEQLHRAVDKMNSTQASAMTQESQLSLLTAGESQDQIVWASQPVIPFGRMRQTDSRIN